MSVSPYKIKVITATRYEFVSCGPKGKIAKVVEITELEKKGIFNLGFGDMRADGYIDDCIITNNFDAPKVFATIVDIICDFLNNNPSATLFFQGSTERRTRFYEYILKRYYHSFCMDFSVTAILNIGDNFIEVVFEPDSTHGYLAFLVRKK